MTLHEAKELERLKWGESVNKRLKSRNEKQAEIDRTVNRRSGAWHAERAKLVFDFINEDIEDHIRIRKELIGQCPDLASEYDLRQFENRLSSSIEDRFQNAVKNFQVMGVRAPASILSELATRKQALRHRIHSAVRMILLETPKPTSASAMSASLPSPAASADHRFKIALSFPGEVRERVQNIAEILSSSVPREAILYDRWLQPELARFNLDTYLTDLYHKHSLLLVIFLSGDYERKEWCSLEWRTVRDLIKQKHDDRVMLLRLDDAEITGLRSIDGYLDIRQMTDADIAAAILKRLDMVLKEPLPEKSADNPPEIDIPDAPEYWQQRKLLGSTEVFSKIQARPRWCIWVRPAEFKPARFRNVEQCADFMRRFTNTTRSRYPVFRDDLIETGNDWVGCECEDEGKFHLYLQRWVLFRSAQFVHNLALDHQAQLGDRTHVLEILDRVTVAYDCAALMAKQGIISRKALLSFSFCKIGGRQLTWPQDAVGDTNLVHHSSWSEDDQFEVRRIVDADRLGTQGRELALDTAMAIYAKFRWSDPPKPRRRSEQLSRFGSALP